MASLDDRSIFGVRSITPSATPGGDGGPLTNTVPSIVTSDKLVAFCLIDDNLPLSAPVNAGYTWVPLGPQVGPTTTGPSGGVNMAAFLCAAPAAGSNVVFTHGSGSGGDDKVQSIWVLIGAGAVDAVASTTDAVATPGSALAPSANPTTVGDILICAIELDAGQVTVVPPAAMTAGAPVKNDYLSYGDAYKILSSSGATGTQAFSGVTAGQHYNALSITIASAAAASALTTRATTWNVASTTTTVSTTRTTNWAVVAGPVAAYNFNEGTGTTSVDCTGNGHTATVKAGAWVTGHTGTGIGSIANAATAMPYPSVPNTFTMMCWVQLTGYGWAAWISNNGGSSGLSVFLQADPSGTPYFGTYYGEAHTTTPIPLNTWTHLAGTWDGSLLRLFVNGVNVASGPMNANASGFFSPGQTFTLGVGANLIQDDTRFFAFDLSAADIVAYMNTPVAPPVVTARASRSTTWNVASGLTTVGGVTRATTWKIAGRATVQRATSWSLIGLNPFAKSVHPSGRYLLDQFGQPYFVLGDGQWTMPSRILSASDRATYWTNRAANGFNCVLIDVIDGPGKFNPTSDPSHYLTFAGDYPFGGVNHDDITSLTPSHWNRIDTIVNEAEAAGNTVWLVPTNGQDMIATLNNAGTANCQAYGVLLGNRYKNKTNLIWLFGEDYTPTTQADASQLAVMAGIRSTGDTHLSSMEMFNMFSISSDWTHYPGNININWVYSYPAVYSETRLAYAANAGPTLMGESAYENEWSSTDLTHHKEMGWALTSGAAAGFIKGNNPCWNIHLAGPSGGPNGPWTNITNTNVDIAFGKLKAWYTGLIGWFRLAPDLANTFLTAGMGVKKDTSTSTTNDDSDYGTAALATDRSFGLIFAPANRDLTVDTTQVNAVSSTSWVDASNPQHTVAAPSTGTPTATVFAYPGLNQNGDYAWYLLIQGVPLVQVTTSRATTWTVRTSVGVSRSTIWNVNATLVHVTISRATTWTVAAATTVPVTTSRSTTWTVRTPVSANRTTTWTVRTSVPVTRMTWWKVASTRIALGSVVIDGVRTPVASLGVVIDGVNKPVVNQWVVSGGVKKAVVG